jgi:hypothetical protein
VPGQWWQRGAGSLVGPLDREKMMSDLDLDRTGKVIGGVEEKKRRQGDPGRRPSAVGGQQRRFAGRSWKRREVEWDLEESTRRKGGQAGERVRVRVWEVARRRPPAGGGRRWISADRSWERREAEAQSGVSGRWRGGHAGERESGEG